VLRYFISYCKAESSSSSSSSSSSHSRIIIIMINDKTCMLMDVAVPSDRNVMQIEAEKKLKIQ
jgi:hypothetical protein